MVRAAVAVELVHSATLVHDDLIDAAQLRRGRPTVAAAAGRRMAVATGDLLFSRAFAELARNEDSEQLQALSQASSALAEGELLQRQDAWAAHVAVERYMHRCELKTAALFEAACRLGALNAVDGSRELAAALGAFARRIGLAFQMLDDILDVSGPVERTGKARGTDLLDGTVTLPFILARERDPGLARVELRALGGPRQAEALCERIAATGALDEAREQALGVVAGAKASLPEILPGGRSELLELVADAGADRRAARSSPDRARRRVVPRRPGRRRPRGGTRTPGSGARCANAGGLPPTSRAGRRARRCSGSRCAAGRGGRWSPKPLRARRRRRRSAPRRGAEGAAGCRVLLQSPYRFPVVIDAWGGSL